MQKNKEKKVKKSNKEALLFELLNVIISLVKGVI